MSAATVAPSPADYAPQIDGIEFGEVHAEVREGLGGADLLRALGEVAGAHRRSTWWLGDLTGSHRDLSLSARRPLTQKQQRAAALIGQGWMKRRAAAEVGVHARTVSTWLRRDDFVALVAQARRATVAETPTAEDTLRAALAATTAAGAPDWRTRVAAARALIGADGPTDAASRETVIYAENLEG